MLQLHINLGRTLGLLWVAVHLIACHPLDISNFDKSVQITHVGSDHIGFLNASVAICTDPDYPPFRSSLPYLLQDCQRALGQLRGIANEKGEDTRYEFVNATTEPIFPDVKPVRLPLKVISESCTVAIVMHGDFEPGVLPHERASPYEFARSDRRTFGQLFDTAKNIYDDCSSGKFQGQVPLGWSEEGDLNAIIMAFWPTQSPIDVTHPAADKTIRGGDVLPVLI